MPKPEPAGPALLDPALHARMIEMRRHLHRHPELSNDEGETQRHLRRALEAEGLTEVRDVAGYGLAVDIVGTASPSARTVVIRADIDALPIQEEPGAPFRSERPGVMHACGHDAHAAMGFAAAALLHRRRETFGGTVRVIFQPAEEAEPLGGRRVVEEGLLDDVEAAIGLHVDPDTETGSVAVAPGPCTLACDIFDLTVSGASAHAATPAKGVDAIATACAIVTELQKIVARESGPFDPLVVSVTGIAGGGAYNVLAAEVALKGTIRSGHPATRARAARRVAEIAEGVARCHGASATLRLVRGEPPVVNDAGLARLVQESAAALLGPARVLSKAGWAAADDFGFYSEVRPAVYVRLGIRSEAAGSVHPLHHPGFRVDEAALPAGVHLLVDMAKRCLAADRSWAA